MTENLARNKLLQMIENGDISADEGLRLLNAIEAGETKEKYEEEFVESFDQNNVSHDLGSDTQPITPKISTSALEPKEIKKSHLWWIIPFAIGLLLTIAGVVWMYQGYVNKGLGWGFWLSWIPFGIGILIMVISAATSKSKWIHIKVHEKHGEKPVHFTLAFPLPIKLSKWFLKNFGNKVIKDKNVPIDSLIEVLDSDISKEEPFYIQVDDDDDQVEIYIA